MLWSALVTDDHGRKPIKGRLLSVCQIVINLLSCYRYVAMCHLKLLERLIKFKVQTTDVNDGPYNQRLNNAAMSTSILQIDRLLFGTPLRTARTLSPADVVEYVSFLTSDATDHVTGSGLYIDGALTMTCTVSHALPVRMIASVNYWMQMAQGFARKLFGSS